MRSQWKLGLTGPTWAIHCSDVSGPFGGTCSGQADHLKMILIKLDQLRGNELDNIWKDEKHELKWKRQHS